MTKDIMNGSDLDECEFRDKYEIDVGVCAVTKKDMLTDLDDKFFYTT